jgi:hypothetical protein
MRECKNLPVPPSVAGSLDCPGTDDSDDRLVLVAVFLGLLYILVPNHLGAHGSILKPRLILLCPLLGLAALRLPASPGVRRAIAGGLGALLAVNSVLLFGHFRLANREIAESTAGLPCDDQPLPRALPPGSRPEARWVWATLARVGFAG